MALECVKKQGLFAWNMQEIKKEFDFLRRSNTLRFSFWKYGTAYSPFMEWMRAYLNFSDHCLSNSTSIEYEVAYWNRWFWSIFTYRRNSGLKKMWIVLISSDVLLSWGVRNWIAIKAYKKIKNDEVAFNWFVQVLVVGLILWLTVFKGQGQYNISNPSLREVFVSFYTTGSSTFNLLQKLPDTTIAYTRKPRVKAVLYAVASLLIHGDGMSFLATDYKEISCAYISTNHLTLIKTETPE